MISKSKTAQAPAEATPGLLPEGFTTTPEQTEPIGAMSELGLAMQPAAAYAQIIGYVTGDATKAWYDNSALKRFHDRSPVLQGVSSDLRETNSKLATLGLGAAAITYQLYDRRRWIVTVVPPAIISTMEETGSSNKAGLIGGLIFAGWIGLGAESTSAGIGRFPNTTDRLAKKFSNAVTASSKALGTAEQVTVKQKEESDPELSKPARLLAVSKKVAKTAMKPVIFPLKHFGRGLKTIGLGSTAYVATARAQGRSSSEIRKKVTLPLVADSFFTVGAIGKGTTEGLKQLALHGHHQAAENIQNVLESEWTWNGVAGFTIALGLGFWVNDRHNQKKMEAENRANRPLVLDNDNDEQ